MPGNALFFQIVFKQYTVFISRTVWSKLTWKLHDDIWYDDDIQTKQDVHIFDALSSDLLRKYSLYYKFWLRVSSCILSFEVYTKNVIAQAIIRMVNLKKITTIYEELRWWELWEANSEILEFSNVG